MANELGVDAASGRARRPGRVAAGVTWVCDIDGVLAGFEAQAVAEAWGRVDRLTVMVPAHGRIQEHTLHVAPDLIDAIEALRHEFVIDWAWQTTWCEGGRVPLFTEALGGRLEGGRMLPVPEREEGIYLPYHWRSEGLLAEVKRSQPAAVLWTDDAIERDAEERLADITVPCYPLQPYEYSGLSPDDLDMIRGFLEDYGTLR